MFGAKIRNNKEWQEVKSVFLEIIIWARTVFPQLILLKDPFWLQKITTDPHILAEVNIECPDDGYAKLKFCISEMASDS